jgi:hypothetical protein
LLPAAAWYFIFIVGLFLPPQGKKKTHKELNMTGKQNTLKKKYQKSDRVHYRALDRLFRHP